MSIHHRRRSHVYLSWKVWLIYAGLFGVGIPWYWPREQSATWLGVPVWAAVAFVSSVVLSMYTTYLLSRPWPQELQPDSVEESP